MRCKNCKSKVTKENLVTSGIFYFCSEYCRNEYKPKVKIRQVSKTNNNTPAKFTNETKAQILLRDKHCIICGNGISDYHHIYYGGQAEYGEDRNEVNKGVGLCKEDHYRIHHGNSGLSQELRKKCIDYINNL